MKNKILAVLILSTITLTGCAKYQKDESFDTELYGTYSRYSEAYDDVDDKLYVTNEEYSFNRDDTYSYKQKETINGEIYEDLNKSGEILSINEFSDDIIEIITNPEIYYKYKYKNMLGRFDEIEVPNGKTFDLKIDDSVWFDKDGIYHWCSGDEESCDCDDKYIRKGNIIYLKNTINNNYYIWCYILDDGLFSPEYTKEK